MNTFYEKLVKKLNTVKFNLFNCLTDINADNRGMGVIEIVLIILVLVGLVLIFKSQVTSIITSVFSKVTKAINGF